MIKNKQMKNVLMILLMLFIIKSTFAENPKRRIISLEKVSFDTIIEDYYINYTIGNNKNIVKTFFKNSDTTYYYDRTLILSIKYRDMNILQNKEFTKMDFKFHFPNNDDDINKYCIQSIDIDKINKDFISFIVTLCIPDTDLYYDFPFIVYNDSSIIIKNPLEEEYED